MSKKIHFQCKRLKTFTKSTDRERYETYWNPLFAGQNLAQCSSTWSRCTSGQPKDIREPKFSRICYRGKSSKKTMRIDSSISGIRSTRQSWKKEHCHQTVQKTTKQDKQYDWHWSIPWERFPTPSSRRIHMWSLITTWSTLWHAGRSWGELQIPLHSERLRHLLQHDTEGVHQKVHPHRRQDRDIREDSRRGCTHTVKRIINSNTGGTWRQRVSLLPRSFRKYPAEENSMRDPTTNSTNKVVACYKRRVLGPPEKSKLWRERKNLEEVQQGRCRRHNDLCQWRNTNKHVERTRGASSKCVSRRLYSHPRSHKNRDTTSKPERQVRRNCTARPRISTHRQLQKKCQHWNIQDRMKYSSTTERWDWDPVYRASSCRKTYAQRLQSLESCSDYSDQNWPNISPRKGRKRSSLGRLENRKRRRMVTGRRRQTGPRIHLSLSADKGTFSRHGKPCDTVGTQKTCRKRNQQTNK